MAWKLIKEIDMFKATIEIVLWLLLFSVVYLAFNPEAYGKWSARAEYAFHVEANRIGLWGE